MPQPVPNLDQLPSLPLFAQVLVASRLVRRAVLALLPDDPVHTNQSESQVREAAIASCDAVDRVVFRARGIEAERSAFDRARRARLPANARSLVEALHFLFDATEAAVAAYDFPVDHTVTTGVQRCIAAIVDDPRVNPMQIAILVAADIDLLRFACREAGVETYDGLGDQVRGRLTPVHALTATEPVRSAEENAR